MISVALWIVVTLAIYAVGVWLFQRSGQHLLCLPVLTGTAMVLVVLAWASTGYAVYAEATRALRWLAGPAVIALAVPLYRQAALLRQMALPLLGALFAGCLMAVLGTLAVAKVLGTPLAFALSLAPKSATMPIAMQAAERAGGVPAVAAMAVVATGVLGAWLTGPVLRWLRVDYGITNAFALGLVAHSLGIVRALQTHPRSVAFAALAMGLNGVCTAFVLTVLTVLAGWL